MLFKVTDKLVREDNPEIDSVPEFKDVPDRVLKFIFLVYDYKSAYRMLSLQKRKYKCAEIAGFKMETDGKRLDKNAREVVSGAYPGLNKIIKAFNELQDDQEMEMLVSARIMIDDCNELMRKPDKNEKEIALAFKMMEKMPETLSTKRKLESLIESRGVISTEDDNVVNDDKQISTIDEVNSEDQD